MRKIRFESAGRHVWALGSFLLSVAFQNHLVHLRRQVCKRAIAMVLPFEGHASGMVGIARLDQQGPVDLAQRRLGVGVDDVPPGRDEAVGAEHVEDQRHVAAAMAAADAVGLLPGGAGRRQGWADEVFRAHSRRGPGRQQEVEFVHPVDLCQVCFQMPLLDAVDRKLNHRQGGFLAALTRRG